MTHSEQARATAAQTGWDLDAYAKERGWSGVGIGPVGQHRDSDTVARSNFAVIEDDMGELADTVCFLHVAHGWREDLTYDTGSAHAEARVALWRWRLTFRPVLNDHHHATLEIEEAAERQLWV